MLGIESTAHTFGVGVWDGGPVYNELDMYRPEKGGIVPREAAEHHLAVAEGLLGPALEEAPDLIAYSACPGIGPCLRVGRDIAARLARELGVPLVPVNHAVAHLEIGLATTPARDPVFVYISGGNTQIIVRGWRILGETLDIALGNALDKLARELGLPHPGGPKLEKLARGGRFLPLPYVVKGMDLSYSGLFTRAKQLLESHSARDIAYSYQEHAFAMLVEVAERAMAHTGKEEVLLIGGVAQNRRLKEMFEIMCAERGARAYAVPPEFAGDNGAMIAYSGLLAYERGLSVAPERAEYFQRARVDSWEDLFRS